MSQTNLYLIDLRGGYENQHENWTFQLPPDKARTILILLDAPHDYSHYHNWFPVTYSHRRIQDSYVRGIKRRRKWNLHLVVGNE